MKLTKYYYECHVTIEPIFDTRLLQASEISRRHGFRIADLLMQKRKNDKAQRSKYDTFMTGRDKDYVELETRMRELISELQSNEFKVWRYKIEDTLLDSKFVDELELL